MIIATDFDGTLCENEWPGIGAPNRKIINYIRKCQKDGDKIILWSCRMDEDLKKALKWCKDQGLHFDAVNENLPEVIKAFGADSRKIYADMYLDDHAINAFEERAVNALREVVKREQGI